MRKYAKHYGKKYDPQFASSVTSMAFSLNLSRNMIMKMVAIKNGQLQLDLWRMAGVPDACVPAGWSLEKRGLVWSPDANAPGLYRLTEAGEHVYALLEIAGLVSPLMAKIEKETA